MSELIFTRLFYCNLKYKNPIIVHVGGTRSSKSYSVAQTICYKFLNESKKDFLVVRKTFPALKRTAYKDIIDVLKEWNVYNPYNHNLSDHTIKNKANGSTINFVSIDDPEKIKSTGYNYIWIEEAIEFSIDDFWILRMRLSGKKLEHEKNQIFITLNPSDVYSWVNTKLKDNPDAKFIYSNFVDNPTLDKDYTDMLRNSKNEDMDYYRVYALGEWTSPQSLIYNNYTVIKDIDFPTEFDDTIYGLDFGYNNPTALIKVGIKDQKNLYISEEIYQSLLTNADLTAKIKTEVNDIGHTRIYADSAEPDRIFELNNADLNVFNADKGKGSVGNGIDFLKRCKLYINENAVSVIKELQAYKWKKDRAGNVLDEPAKFNDHAMDAIRYAIYTHNLNSGIGISVL